MPTTIFVAIIVFLCTVFLILLRIMMTKEERMALIRKWDEEIKNMTPEELEHFNDMAEAESSFFK